MFTVGAFSWLIELSIILSFSLTLSWFFHHLFFFILQSNFSTNLLYKRGYWRRCTLRMIRHLIINFLKKLARYRSTFCSFFFSSAIVSMISATLLMSKIESEENIESTDKRSLIRVRSWEFVCPIWYAVYFSHWDASIFFFGFVSVKIIPILPPSLISHSIWVCGKKKRTRRSEKKSRQGENVEKNCNEIAKLSLWNSDRQIFLNSLIPMYNLLTVIKIRK